MPQSRPLALLRVPKRTATSIQTARALLDSLADFEVDGQFLLTVESEGDVWVRSRRAAAEDNPMTVDSIHAAEMIQDAKREGWAEGFMVGNERGLCNGYEMCLLKLDQVIEAEANQLLARYLRAVHDALRLAAPNPRDPEGM